MLNRFSEIANALVIALRLFRELWLLRIWLLRKGLGLPLFLRSVSWAKHEIKRIKDPSHPLHRPYWGTSGGFGDVSKREHEKALAQVCRLYRKAYPEPQAKRLRSLLA